jgi:succinylglutamate desuccinylase
MMQEVVAQMAARSPFASIDLHNNTGRNPHYGCVNLLEPVYLQLAALFSRTVVYFTQPAEVQSIAFSRLCPAVTVECGRPGEPHGVAHAVKFLQHCLELCEIPTDPLPDHTIDLFHTVATVKIPAEIKIGFGTERADLCLIEDLDQLNFQEIPAGTTFGRRCSDHLNHLQVWSESGEDLGDHFFEVEAGELRTRRAVMPSMLTRDVEIIRQDCLCYLMERLNV